MLPDGRSEGSDKKTIPSDDEDTTGSEQRRQPELERATVVELAKTHSEFDFDQADDGEEDAVRNSRLRDTMRQMARQASLDPGDGIEL